MARFLFTMLPANDLGLPTRLLPVALELAERGHEVAVFNPSPAPSALIADAGLRNLPVPSRAVPDAPPDLVGVSRAWDTEELLAALFPDEDLVRANTALHVDLFRDFKPDMVVDSFGPFGCLAARILGIPLASILQGNFHPESSGYLYWAGERPASLPGAGPVFSKIAAEYGLAPIARSVELLAGDLSLIVGTPETDPVSPTAHVTHIGPIVWQRGNAELPPWIASLNPKRPVVWVYSGNPRYAGAAGSTACDSIVVIRAAIAALADAPVHVVLTTGYQDVPAEIGTLPANFHHAAYLPGRAMAERSDLMVHHAAGPLARTVADAAKMLNVLVGYDPNDPATAWSVGHIEEDYSKFLNADGVKRKRIGVLRSFFGAAPINEEVNSPGRRMSARGL